MIFLKQSTSVTVKVGPFVDSTDGVTAETGLTISQADVRLSKNGGNYAQKNESSSATHDELGEYNIPLDSTDTNTVGALKLIVAESGALPVWQEFMVLPANIYDSFVGGSDRLQVDVLEISSDSTAADNAESFFDGTGYAGTNNVIPTTTNVTNTVSADVISISGDTTAADNLELQYDGTGLTGDFFPATQSQIGNIAIAGSAINQIAESYTLTTGTQSSGTYASTQSLDGTDHVHTDSAGTMELYYQFDIGNNGIPTSVKVDGNVSGNGDNLGVYAYNWSGTTWNQIGTLIGTNTDTDETNTYDLLTSHVGTGSNVGKVRVRFYAASGLGSATLRIDRILLSYTQATQGIANGSTITLSSSTVNTNLIGHNWALALNSQDITGSYFYQATNVSGTGTGTNGTPFTFQQCNILTSTLDAFGFFHECAIASTLTLVSTSGVTADNINLLSCYSGVAGSGTPTIDASGVTKTTNIQIRDWKGGLTYVGTSDCTTSIEIMKGGTLNVTTGGGNVEIRGIFRGLNVTLSGNETVRFIGTTGHIVLSGATSGGASTFNAYGIASDITDNTTGDGCNVDDDTISRININIETDTALSDIGLDHLISASVTGTDITDNSIVAKLVSSSATADWDDYVNTSDSLQAIRDRGDAAWTTGGGGSLTQILNVQPILPTSIDLANTATVRLGLILTNAVDDLPSTSEITPGTISIDRKTIGGTSWSSIVTDAAMSEQAGMVYYDEVFDSGTGYAEGDSIRVTFKSVSITADANAYEICDSNGIIFQTEIRQTMRGTNNSLLASSAPTNFGDLSITASTGMVTVGTNNDKTGYSISGTLTTLDALDTAQDSQHSITQSSIAGLNDFDPANDVVANVTTTANVTNTVSADVVSISGDSVAANNLESDYDGTGYNKANSTIGTTTTNTDMRGTDNAFTGTAASIRSEIDSNSTQLATIVEDTGTTIPSQISGLNDLSVSDIQGITIDGTKDLQEVLQDLWATIVGNVTPSGTTTLTLEFKAPDGTTTRRTHTVSTATGQRSQS